MSQPPYGVPALPLYAIAAVVFAMMLPSVLFVVPEGQQDLVKTAMVGLFGVIAAYGLVLCDKERLIAAKPLVWSVVPLVAVYVIGTGETFYTNIFDGVKCTLQIIITAAWLVFIASVDWHRRALFALTAIAACLLAVHLATFPVIVGDDGPTGLTTNKNTFGALCLVITALFSMVRAEAGKPAFSPIVLGIPLVALVLCESRAPVLAIFVAIGVNTIWPLVSRSNGLMWSFILLLFLTIGLITYFYTVLEDYDWYWQIKDIYADVTDQNIYSGRNLIWPILFQKIELAPWLGYGPGASANTFLQEQWLDVEWSAHNMYVFFCIQVGMIGLAAFLYHLSTIWMLLRRACEDPVARVSGAYFIGLCFHQCFETALAIEQPQVRFALWLIPAVGLSRALRRAHARDGLRLAA